MLALTYDASGATAPHSASFQVQNVLTVKVPKDAHTVRIWFAVPQQNAYTVVTDFTATTPYHVQYHEDSWGNRVGYVDVIAILRGRKSPLPSASI